MLVKYVFSHCAFADCHQNVVILLFQYLVYIQAKVKAVILNVGFDLAYGADGKPPVVLAVEAVLAFLIYDLKCREHYVFDLLVSWNVEMVHYLSFLFQFVCNVIYQSVHFHSVVCGVSKNRIRRHNLHHPIRSVLRSGSSMGLLPLLLNRSSDM